eukprot:sb/3466413/
MCFIKIGAVLSHFKEGRSTRGKLTRQELTETSKQTIRTRYLCHVTGYQSIRNQYFLIRSIPGYIHEKRRRDTEKRSRDFKVMRLWTIVPRDSVVHHHLCHEGGARVVQVAREPVGRTEFVILKTRPQGVFLEYLCHDRREWYTGVGAAIARIYGTKISLILPFHDKPSIVCGWINSTDYRSTNLAAQTFTVSCPSGDTAVAGVILEDRTRLSSTSDNSVLMNIVEVYVYGTVFYNLASAVASTLPQQQDSSFAVVAQSYFVAVQPFSSSSVSLAFVSFSPPPQDCVGNTDITWTVPCITVGPRFSDPRLSDTPIYGHPDLVTKTLFPEDVTKSGSDCNCT